MDSCRCYTQHPGKQSHCPFPYSFNREFLCVFFRVNLAIFTLQPRAQVREAYSLFSRVAITRTQKGELIQG